jgi:hypothetical protein
MLSKFLNFQGVNPSKYTIDPERLVSMIILTLFIQSMFFWVLSQFNLGVFLYGIIFSKTITVLIFIFNWIAYFRFQSAWETYRFIISIILAFIAFLLFFAAYGMPHIATPWLLQNNIDPTDWKYVLIFLGLDFFVLFPIICNTTIRIKTPKP